MTAAVDTTIARLSRELAEEERRIAEAVAARQIGDNSGYWQYAHELRRRLQVARALRGALEEEGD